MKIKFRIFVKNLKCFNYIAGGAFFIFHQITDELSTKHETRLRTTCGAMISSGLRAINFQI